MSRIKNHTVTVTGRTQYLVNAFGRFVLGHGAVKLVSVEMSAAVSREGHIFDRCEAAFGQAQALWGEPGKRPV